MELAAPLAEQLSGWPHARLVSAKHVEATLGPGIAQADYSNTVANTALREWLNRLEAAHRYVILVADNAEDNWALRCLRMADRIMVLTEADSSPRALPVMQKMPGNRVLAPVELVLLRPEGDPSPHTMAWRKIVSARSHYYVHPWDKNDLAALARQMTGRGIGLVLGGGGARGFAHIGLIRALRELGIPIDVMGGTSMGAFVSALLACGFDSVEMAQIARETFVNNNYLNDYHLPRVSLIKGRRFLTRLKEIFGERLIEELPRSFYCVSTNLSSGAAVTHDNGSLANWVGTSMCVPGVVPPVAHEGDLLCDGGVVDNLPTDVMQNLERGAIIACSVSADGDIRATGHGLGLPEPEALLNWRSTEPRPRFSEILLRTATLTSDTLIQRAAVERADFYMRMPVQRFGMFNWQNLDQLVELGYQHALEHLTPQRETLLKHQFNELPVVDGARQEVA
jgi:NTE family protein